MSSRTISLEQSAYELLKSAKLPGESFSDVVNRLLKGQRPSFGLFEGLLTKKQAARLEATIERMRSEDLEIERKRQREWKRKWA